MPMTLCEPSGSAHMRSTSCRIVSTLNRASQNARGYTRSWRVPLGCIMRCVARSRSTVVAFVRFAAARSLPSSASRVARMPAAWARTVAISVESMRSAADSYGATSASTSVDSDAASGTERPATEAVISCSTASTDRMYHDGSWLSLRMLRSVRVSSNVAPWRSSGTGIGMPQSS